jgi:hypothetical protein
MMIRIRGVIALAMVVGMGLVFLAACNAGGVNIGNAQRPLFAPAPGSPIAVAGGPGDVLVGDMNNDGNPDLVVACAESRTIVVLIGNGNRSGDRSRSGIVERSENRNSGDREGPGNSAASDGPESNGADKSGAGNNSFELFRVTPASTLSVAESPGDMVLGDVNSDGNLDFAFVSHDSYDVTLLLGDGKGALSPAKNSPIVMKQGQHPHTHGLGIGDLNGDGKLDLATVNNSDNDVSVAFGDGRGNFTIAPSSPFSVGPSPYPMALGDVNNDGRLDIVATTTATGPLRRQQLPFSRALTLLLNDGRGGFRKTELPLRTGQPWSVAIGDVNGDRKPDLVATHHEQTELTLLLGDGRGGFTEAAGSPFNFGRGFQIALADVNRDGYLDAVAAAGNVVRIALGDGHGNFKPALEPFPIGAGSWNLAVSDVNKDGKVDLVTGNSESNTVSVLLGQ